MLRAQRYAVRSAVVQGMRVALETLWVGTLAVPVGSLPAGGEMRAHFAMFLDFEEGLIRGQRNYRLLRAVLTFRTPRGRCQQT